MKPSTLLGSRPDPVPPEVAGRLRHWVRTCLALGEDDVVMVTQLACRDAGCSPVETVLAVLRPGAPLRRTVPLPAELVSIAHVQHAFAAVAADLPGSDS